MIDVDPANFNAYHLLGLIAIRITEWELAVQLLLKSIEFSPSQAGVHVNLGVALIKLGRIEDAVFCLQRASQIDPSDVVIYHNLSNLYEVIDYKVWESHETSRE